MDLVNKIDIVKILNISFNIFIFILIIILFVKYYSISSTAGPAGMRGPDGIRGPDGMRGLDGFSGPIGPTGPAGNSSSVSSSTIYPPRKVNFLNNIGGGIISNNAAGSIIYSYNQTPAQWIIDAPAFSPEVGTEYIIYNGNVNTGFIQTYSPSVAFQISGTVLYLNDTRIVALNTNCKCVATKVSSTLWVIQGDGLSYTQGVNIPGVNAI
jgi:hypothetical protein